MYIEWNNLIKIFGKSIKLVFSVLVIEHWHSIVWHRFRFWWPCFLLKKMLKNTNNILKRKAIRFWDMCFECSEYSEYNKTNYQSFLCTCKRALQSVACSLEHYGLVLCDRDTYESPTFSRVYSNSAANKSKYVVWFWSIQNTKSAKILSLLR